MPIQIGTNNAELREELSKITGPADAAELKAQIDKVSKLALRYPHSISLLQENVPDAPVFNCYQYSFDIRNGFFKMGILKVPLGRDFAQFLVDHHLHEIDAADVENGDHVFYASAQINHAGKVNDTAVESKWGTGHLWCHAIYEVPAYYGDNVRFFKRIDPQDCIRAFLECNPSATFVLA